MNRYANRSGRSSVLAYFSGPDSIQVQFTNGSVYLYTYGSTGMADVERMKQLAVAGRGLGGYISSVVKKRYARKIR